MKPRHAAALALIGWYLLLPPKQGLIVKPAAPMRDWKIEQSFKTIRECEDFRHNVATATLVLENIRIARALAGEIEIDPNTEMGHIADVLGDEALLECVASDDPRLTKK
jgi:hypothetical protein